MTVKDKKYDESKPSARFVVLMGLLFTGQHAGLLSLDALRTSPVSMAYAVALATAAAATLAFVARNRNGDRAGEEGAPRTGPVWHESTMFTDPWYQVPAVFCVFILASRFVLDLVAEPPATERAVWFLAGLGIATLAMAFGLTGGAVSKKGSEGDEADGEGTPAEAESQVEAALRDPWFSVPASAIFFLHFARDGLDLIEEDPESPMATVILLMPVAAFVVGLVSFAVARARQKRAEASVVVDAGSVGVRGELGEPEA